MSDQANPGFTNEDVELLQLLLENGGDSDNIVIDIWLDEERTATLRSLATRIAALLPPKDP